jgi:hypothetical protein
MSGGRDRAGRDGDISGTAEEGAEIVHCQQICSGGSNAVRDLRNRVEVDEVDGAYPLLCGPRARVPFAGRAALIRG